MKGNSRPGDAIDAFTGDPTGQFGPFAADFDGGINVNEGVYNNATSIIIDYPLDPAHKYVSHSSVESPDIINIYNGNVVTDANGDAVVPLPEWFETLNRDFRYQLTVIGQFVPSIATGEVANHQFSLRTDKPGVKVSWQVTGIRQDLWANVRRIPVKEERDARDGGHDLRPELYGAPEQARIAWACHPETMTRIKETREESSRLPQASGIADPPAAAKR